MRWSHAHARVGVPGRGGGPHTYLSVHLWMRGRRTLAFVNGWPRWACKRTHRHAAWVFERSVRHTINQHQEATHA